ncbi:hypothetical protein FACS189498_1750 [Spirochaetia bacterium]|nr:hypothetical protein FACS189498_1750 [Spirochaetia bacterium]
MKKTAAKFFFVFFLLISYQLTAQQLNRQQAPWWFSLEQGKLLFRSGEYGDALAAFEEARRVRGAVYSRMEQDFIDLLSISEVRRLGDSLELIEKYIADGYQVRAAAALAELYYRVPKAALANSGRRVLSELNRLKDYPEAEYWIGEVYRLDGELVVALKQYEKAYELRSLLETPGFDVEILYKIVDIHRQRQEYPEMEKRANEILERDSLWSGDSEGALRQAMIQNLKNDGVVRFLTIYRYNNPVVERAHRLLGLFHYASGRHYQAQEHLAFAFMIQNTVLIDEVIRKRYDYSFTGLNGLMAELNGRPELLSYMEDVDYYKTIYYFADSLYGAGNALPARQFWTFLGSRGQAREWRGRAQGQLANPLVSSPTVKVLEIP